jgi:hypothetical protein
VSAGREYKSVSWKGKKQVERREINRVTGRRRKTGIRQEDQLSWKAEREKREAGRWTGKENR